MELKKGANEMLEKFIEQKLCREVHKKGGLCLKFTTPSINGMPDRLILSPHGQFAFVELKQKGKKPRRLQSKRLDMLRNLGFKTFVIDNSEQISEVLDEIT